MAQTLRHVCGTQQEQVSLVYGLAALQAQFLIRASFGPTLASLQDLTKKPYQKWIDEQMLLPAGLHRAFWSGLFQECCECS